ncbi:MAG: GcrA family cell cycle regulator [Alphaproteobacteria bacterium]|nr:GcrA family cell cycle regulator [Alphaproteobacteria bacterium]
MSWTQDRVDLLTKLWGEGKTAAEIAQTLGGVTRNAVIGKAHRLELSGRISPIQQNKILPPKKNASSREALPKPVAQASVRVSERNAPKVQLTDLGPRMCRWPLGDPREENFGFCGCDSLGGLPYCADHAKLAYQAATRNRILKAEEEMASIPAQQPVKTSQKGAR